MLHSTFSERLDLSHVTSKPKANKVENAWIKGHTWLYTLSSTVGDQYCTPKPIL